MLENLVKKNILPNDKILLKEVERAASMPNSFLAVVNFAKPGYEFVGPTCHALTGYSCDDYLKGGSEFIFSITTQETSLAIIQNQISFSLETKLPGFDPRSIRIHEHPVEFRSGFGYPKTLITLGLPLTYTINSDMEFGLALHAEVKSEIIKQCKERLTRIKERHNTVYQHAALQNRKDPLNKVFVQKRPNQNLTTREEEILKLMAKGFTSAEIAAALFIGENTVETHRKNIFQKFEAKNIAELIKKASKLYCLE